MAFELVAHSTGDVHFTWFCEPFQARGDIDAVAVDIVIIGDHIAGIDADAKPYPAIAAGARIIRAQPFLYLEPAGNGIGRAVEFDEKPVRHGPDQAAAMLGDLGLDQILWVIGDRNMGA